MTKTLTHSFLLILLYFSGSFICKTELMNFRETEIKRNYAGGIPGKIITKLLLLNKKIAISQFFQFRMIACYGDFAIPDENICPHCAVMRKHDKHHHAATDIYEKKIRRIIKKYMLMHITDFFDMDRFYRLMRLSLEFDPKNYFTRMYAAHLARNHEMMQKSVEVLEAVYNMYPDWEYAFDIGWLNFYCLRNYSEARKWFKTILQFRHAPRYASNMYQATFALEKKYDQAIQYTRHQMETTTDPSVRVQTGLKLQWFESLSLLAKKAAEYKEGTGKYPGSLDDLVKSGLISEIPTDTIGDGFYWDAEHNEPASLNDPFTLIKMRNPIDIGRIVIDRPEDDARHVGLF